MKIVIAGGTGFIGRALCIYFASQNHEVCILSRKPDHSGFKTVQWDGKNQGAWREVLEGADAVVNLCGQSVAGRWTRSYKQNLIDSRIQSTRILVSAFEAARQKPKVLLNASAIGFYGNRDNEELDESSSQGRGFLAQLCADWEKEAGSCAGLGVRVVCLRTGMVLGRGGALAKMLSPFKLGLGGPLGGGAQWMSWISQQDLARLAAHLIQNDVSGPVNAVAPNPITNKDFSAALAKALHRPSWLPAPALALRLALGEMAQEVLLASQKVFPRRALDSGFSYQHPDLESALRAALQ